MLKTVFLDAGGVLLFPNWLRISDALAQHGVTVDPGTLAAAEPHAKRIVVVLLMAALASACEQGEPAVRLTGPTSSTTTAAQSIAIRGETVLERPGDTSQLTAVLTFSDGTTKDVSADTTWTGFPSSVISITSEGLLTALQYGTATVTAQYRPQPLLVAEATVQVLPDGSFILRVSIAEAGPLPRMSG